MAKHFGRFHFENLAIGVFAQNASNLVAVHDQMACERIESCFHTKALSGLSEFADERVARSFALVVLVHMPNLGPVPMATAPVNS